MVVFFRVIISLTLFVLALRHLGTARTGAYFSTAPFVGAVLSFLLLTETPGWTFWIAAALMAVGVWLHLSEHHEHRHAHPILTRISMCTMSITNTVTTQLTRLASRTHICTITRTLCTLIRTFLIFIICTVTKANESRWLTIILICTPRPTTTKPSP